MKFKRSQYAPTSHFQSTELCLIIIVIIIINNNNNNNFIELFKKIMCIIYRNI